MLRSENLNILVVLVKYGVPQGSVLELRPLLYLLYTAEIPAIFSKHSSSGHIYADDVQAFVHGPSSDQLGLFGRNDALSQELHLWMSSSQLEIAESKQYAVYLARQSPTRRSLTSPTHRKILTLVNRSHNGPAPSYFRDLIRLHSSAISLRPLR